MADDPSDTDSRGAEAKPDPTRGLRFTSERQRRIHARLSNISPGPVAFFADACRILGGDTSLRASSHLVAHLGREIESAIRVVVTGKPRSNASGAHAKSIVATLDALEFPEDHEVRFEWLSIVEGGGFPGRAHRENLLPPRPIDAEFDQWWSRFEAVLDVVLERFEARFNDPLKRAEMLAAIEAPTDADLDRLLQTLPHQPVVVARFFDSLRGPGWLPLLRQAGYLRPPVNTGDGASPLEFTFVPQAAYLARMATVPEAQEIVTDVLLDLGATRHLYSDGDLLATVAALPARLKARLVPRLREWLDGGLVVLDPTRFVAIVRDLTTAGEATAALELLEVLLEPFEDPRAGILGPEARGRFDGFDYWRIIDGTIEAVTTVAGQDALDLVSDLLERALDIGRSRPDAADREDGSWRWCPHIDHPRHDHGVRNYLVMAVRDAAAFIASTAPAGVDSVVRSLRERRFGVFDRIAMHVLVSHGESAPGSVAVFLADTQRWRSAPITDEFQRLCEAQFANVPRDLRSEVTDVIKAGPDVAAWRERFEGRQGGAPTADDERHFVGCWQRDRLALIEEALLEPERDLLAGLVAEFGPAEDDVPVTHGSFSGQGSPLSQAQMEEMDDDALLQYLTEWRERGGWHEPSRDGLSRVLQACVEASHERFSAIAHRFIGLEPEYVAALLGGLQQVVRRHPLENWPSVLRLAAWIMATHPSNTLWWPPKPASRPATREFLTRIRQGVDRALNWLWAKLSSRGGSVPPSSSAGGQARAETVDPGAQNAQLELLHLDQRWGWTRKRLADLLEVALHPGEGRLPAGYRREVWSLIQPLAIDSDPLTADVDADEVNPLDRAINTVRGMALHCVFEYAKWVRYELHPDFGAPGQVRSFAVMPEARSLLEERLAQETSSAVRSAFGLYLPQMVALDRAWVADTLPAMFPAGAPAHRSAAWAVYVVANRPYTSVLELLRGEYLHAISRLGTDTDEARSAATALAEHIMTFYAWGVVGFGENDLLVEAYLAAASDAVRAHGITHQGQALREAEDEIPPANMERLEEYWRRRLSAAQSGDRGRMVQEVAAFGWWFASRRFDVELSLDLLEQGLRLHPRADLDNLVVERLDEVAPLHPTSAVRCLRLMIEGDERGWLVVRSREHVHGVIRHARASGMEGASEAADALVGFLLSRGHGEFRDPEE